MSVNPDDMNMGAGVAEEYVDLEHQVIRQKLAVGPQDDLELRVGETGADFDIGERQLDREEIAQLVYYRRYASAQYQSIEKGADPQGALVDASVGINGDLFREVTTSNVPEAGITVDRGGEIGLLDNYTIGVTPPINDQGGTNSLASGTFVFSEFDIDYYDWPTGGPIVDSFDTLNCGFRASNNNAQSIVDIELRYDFYWDVAEQGRSTNPFGRPSTR